MLGEGVAPDVRVILSEAGDDRCESDDDRT